VSAPLWAKNVAQYSEKQHSKGIKIFFFGIFLNALVFVPLCVVLAEKVPELKWIGWAPPVLIVFSFIWMALLKTDKKKP